MNLKKMNSLLATGALLASSAAFAGGSIAGTVAFNGTAPKMEKLNRKADPVCAKTEANDETVLLSKDGKAVANVVVRITKNAPAGGKVPAEPVTIDQKECLYHPRVQAAMEGQKIQIKNSDGTLHNIHAYAGTKTLFNQAQPPKSKDIEKDLKAADVMKLKCDVHPWMTAYVVLNKNPYFATTNTDGKFEIKDVPAGKYTIEAWHEKLGTQTAEVTVEDGKAADPKIAFSDKKT
jgi:plastocyanin